MKASALLIENETVYNDVSHPRLDGFERVSGLAKYTGDWKKEDMLYARIITSTIAHGRVKKIDSSETASVEGFVDVVTCFDDRTEWKDGEREHRRRVFTDKVRFVGDCIGAITAKTRTGAMLAAESVMVEYDEIPATFTIRSSLESNTEPIWEDGNTFGPLKYGYGDSNLVFSESDMVKENHYSSSRVHNVPLEPAVSLAWWEGDNLTVIAATQSVHGCRAGIAEDLKIPIDKVKVISYFKGGGFGNKASSMNYDLIAAICSRRTGRPVMVEYSRENEFVSVHGRWSSEIDLQMAYNKNGKVNGANLAAYCDVGAYTRQIKFRRFIEGPEYYYSTKSWNANIRPVYTNTPSTGHMRAPTGPQACFATETLIDEIADDLKIDPVKMRLINGITSPYNGTFTSNGLFDCIRLGAEEFDWKKRWLPPARREPEDGIVSGIGMAIASWHSGLGPGEAEIRVSKEGRVFVNTGVVDIGTGAKTTMALIASKYLGVGVDRIDSIWGNTETSPFSVGESGSRTTTYTGYAVKEAACQVKDELLNMASSKYRINKEDLSVRDGTVFDKAQNTPVCDIFDLLKSAGLPELKRKVATSPKLPDGSAMFAFAAHFAEVQVDIETGKIEVTDYLAVHDSGEIVNKLTAESQVQGSVVMGIGMALTEKLIISESNGSVENSSLLLYRVPRSTDIPEIKVKFVNSHEPNGPKALGEIPIVPTPAAIGNAIFNATGVRLRSLPFVRDQLLDQIINKL